MTTGCYKTWDLAHRITSAAVIPALPISMVIYVKPHTLTAGDHILSALNDNGSLTILSIRLRGSSGQVVAQHNRFDTGNIEATGGNVTVDAWNCIVATFTSTSARMVYLNGSAGTDGGGTNAAPGTGAGGTLAVGSTVINGDTKLAVPGLWITSALSSGDATSLITLLPSAVQAGNLWSWYDFTGVDPELDLTASRNLAVNSAATFDGTDHPSLSSSASSGSSGLNRGIAVGMFRGIW